MIGLAFRLSTNGGREGWTRLLAIGAGVMVGVMLLLVAVSGLQILKTSAATSCWWCSPTVDLPENPADLPKDSLLWRPGFEIHDGRQIDRYDIAALSASSPIIPGIDRIVQPGEYFVSPAVADMLEAVPADQLANRFPGKLAGEIGSRGLRSPGDLVVVVGHDPAELQEKVSGVSYLTSLYLDPEERSYPPVVIAMFLAVVAGLLFAIWSLVMAATRLGAARREEKFATLLLFGATPRQIRVIAAVDALLGAAIGVAVAIGLFYLLRPLFAENLAGMLDVYPEQFTPGLLGALIVALGVLLVSVIAALVSLRRVRLSPLGVTRKTTPKPPRAWRFLPLVAGFAIMIVIWLVNKDLTDTLQKADLTQEFLVGFGLTLLGIVLAGPWITQQVTRLFAKLALGAPSLLAARRLADNPKAAFRSVSVLVVAAFLATLMATFAPLLRASLPKETTTGPTVQYTYFLDEYYVDKGGLLLSDAQEPLQKLRSIPGVSVVPWYMESVEADKVMFQADVFIQCADLQDQQSPHFGLCEDADPNAVVHVRAAVAQQATLPHEAKPIGQAEIVSKDLSRSPIQSFEIRIGGGQNQVDRVRTVMAQMPEFFRGGYGWFTAQELQAGSIRAAENVEKVVNGILLIILFVAGCGLAVNAGGGIIERKRPFGLLRVAGMSIGQLRRVVLYESAVPLFATVVVASLLGFFVAALLIMSFANPDEATIKAPSLGFCGILLLGITLALTTILATMPLLNAATKPEKARFE